MLEGIRSKLNAGHILLSSLAVAFVLYHLYAALFGTASFVQAYLPQHPAATAPAHVTPSSTPSATPLLAYIGLQSDKSLWPNRIVMSTVGIDLPVEGSMEQSGAWNISLTGADYALNTAVPNGQSGNTAIFGHDRPKLFHSIHNLKIGDKIDVYTSKGVYTYAMAGSQVVTPTDVSVMDPSTDSTLTLLTCDGWLSQNRFVVHAKFDHFATAK
jgi:LPXTG-site transpeptidase (sortase) family protein